MPDVSDQVVRAYIAARQPEIRAAAGRGPAAVFIPQAHWLRMEAEVDFGEIAVQLRGTVVTSFLLALRRSLSGKSVHRAFASGGQEAFFEGHEHAFHVLGGVLAGRIRYDNLKAAVAQVIGFSRHRVETER
jgi:transposase